ncbi:MAG: prolyl oligopeptidase family serine peptidase [Pseudomarimonas sp.]
MRQFPSPVAWILLPIAAACGSHAIASERPSWQVELEQIMAEPDWIGQPVEAPYWALDGSSIQYSLRRAGSSRRDAAVIRDLWIAKLDGSELAGSAPRAVEDAERSGLDAANPVFDRSRSRALFVRDGDVFVRDLAGHGAPEALTRSAAVEASPQFSSDDQRAHWRVGNDWFAYDFASGQTLALPIIKAEKDPEAAPEADVLRDLQVRLISTLAREKAQREAFQVRQRELLKAEPSRAPMPIYLGDTLRIMDVRLSPDARYMLAVTELKTAEAGQVGKMPLYVTESGYEAAEDVRTRVGRNPLIAQSLHVIDLADGSVHVIDVKPLPGIDRDPLAELRKTAKLKPLEGLRALQLMDAHFNQNGTRLAVALRANDNKDRWIAEIDLAEKKLQPRHRLTDPAWINWNFNEFGWMADQQTLWLMSEESGFSHLYTLAQGDKPKALTSGRWEASAVTWSADGGRAFFLCNRVWPGDYEVCAVNADGSGLVELTAVDGVESFVLSPDDQKLALRVSSSHAPPQLAVLDLAEGKPSGGKLRTLTDTRSEAYRARAMLSPQYVQVPSKHGAGSVWGKLYRPATLEPGKRYPIALFVHGAGYLQNVSARYPNYFREQMFNQMLVEHGYVVLDLDYRASAGYGRDWRTAIYQQMGHPELEDYQDGIAYLVEQHQGDAKRVGIYGGSYGGFMALMALFRAPEEFHAGAALRPVTDWTSYNHEYTSNILNTPDTDPQAYAKSSPIEFAANLQGHLLIAHGMIDDNVFFQDSVRLSQRLIELRKDKWTLAAYPLERHGYVHAESWYDQYRRIFELFETALKPPVETTR